MKKKRKNAEKSVTVFVLQGLQREDTVALQVCNVVNMLFVWKKKKKC